MPPDTSSGRRGKILAVASGGGHWEELVLLQSAFEGHEVHYVTTMKGLAERSGLAHVHVVPDCNRNEPLRALRCTLRLLALQLRLRPAVTISTGALPGLIALAIGRRLGSRTIWVDSIANAEEMSMAGLHARKFARLWMSQWPAVAEKTGAVYAGSVL